MADSRPETTQYPLLEALLRQRGLRLRGIYTNRDAAQIFQVSVRTIQEWSREGKLQARDLPGRGRFLSEDLEAFLQKSARIPRNAES
jgi:transposase